jgi:hypothetical protein
MAMSEEHKAALAKGRREARAIKLYLEALGKRRPGRPVTPDSLKKKIADLTKKLTVEQDPLRAVELRQQRLDAEQALDRAQAAAEIDDLERGFVDHARSYSERKRISYAAWRQSGVPAAVLRKAGISRGS